MIASVSTPNKMLMNAPLCLLVVSFLLTLSTGQVEAWIAPKHQKTFTLSSGDNVKNSNINYKAVVTSLSVSAMSDPSPLGNPDPSIISNSGRSTVSSYGRSTATTASQMAKAKAAGIDWDWQGLAERVFAVSKKPIILFDGVCNFCNGGVNLCLDWDVDARFRYASLQSKVGQALLLKHGKDPNDLSSIVLVNSAKTGDAYFQSDAILRIARELKGLPVFLRAAASSSLTTVPPPLRHALYHFVAENRYVFGESTAPSSCRLDLDGTLANRFVDDPTDEELYTSNDGYKNRFVNNQ